MRYYTITIVLFLLLSALLSGLIAPSGSSSIAPLIMVVVMAVVGSVIATYSRTLEGLMHEFLSREFRRAGYTMPVAYSRILTIGFISVIMLSLSLLALLYILILTPGVSTTLIRVPLALSLLTLILGNITLSAVATLSPKLISTLRASGALVELPFLLATLRVFSRTHLTLYDILKIVETSQTLRWWAEEVKRREVIARERGVSLLTAIGFMAEDHPSLEVRDIIRRISIAGSYAGSPAGVVERISQAYFEIMRSRLERLSGYMYIALGMVLITLFLIPVLAVTLGPPLGIPPLTIAAITVVVAFPVSLIIYTIIQAMYPTGFMLNPSGALKAFYTLSSLVVLGLIAANLYLLATGRSFNPIIAYAILITSLIPLVALTSSYMARVSAYERLLKVVADATELASVTGENLISLMRRTSGGDRRVIRLINDIERAIVDDRVRVKLVREAPSMLYASMIENLVYALRIGAPLTVFAEIATVYEHLGETLRRHQSSMRGVEYTLAVVIAAISIFIVLMIRILSGIVAGIKTPTGAAVPAILQRFVITQDPLLVYAILSSMIVVGIVAGALVEKAKNGTIITSARIILIYIALSMIILVAR
jgi:archaellum biogenesis protein FlaJ (TadC family)